MFKLQPLGIPILAVELDIYGQGWEISVFVTLQVNAKVLIAGLVLGVFLRLAHLAHWQFW